MSFAKIFARKLAQSGTLLQTQISILKNGLRVVTDSTPGHFSALGAYINAGSRYETLERSGISHIIDRMAWKSTPSRSGQQMMEDLAKLGGNYMCGAQRELILYQALVFNKDVDRMFECIAETIRQPLFQPVELAEAQITAQYELEELEHKHEIFLPEVLHKAAYGNHNLGLPLYGTAQSVQNLSKKVVDAFYKQFYQPRNTVLAFVGVSHKSAVEMATSQLGKWENSSTDTRNYLEPAKYLGGNTCLPYREPRYSNMPKLVHMQVAFETGGLLSEDVYALATLQKLLGGGSSFSAGGPGKGMFSRLFRVLNQHQYVENCLAFNHAHSDTGLFGITISCYIEHAEYMAQVVAHELNKVMEQDVSRGGISQSEFKRAQNQLISSLLMNVESKLATLEDLGRQVQCQGKITSVNEMVAKIEALDIGKVRSVARKVFTGNGNKPGLRPLIIMQGERGPFGDVEYVMQYFGLGQFNQILTEPREFRA